MPDTKTKLPQNGFHLFNNGGFTHSDLNLLEPMSMEIPLYTSLTVSDQTDDYMNPASSRFFDSSPNHQSMSPNSRTQAIARGRKELMEMVRDLPEAFYELSLRDIVEKKHDMEVQNQIDPPPENKLVKEMIMAEEKKEKKNSKNAKKNKKKKMGRSTSADNSKFLLKTSVWPVFLGSKKKKKKSLEGSGSFKIGPVQKPGSESMKRSEKDWWRRKSCVSNESDGSNGLSSSISSSSGSSSRSSTRSNSNGSDARRSSRFLPICCFFNRRLKRVKEKN